MESERPLPMICQPSFRSVDFSSRWWHMEGFPELRDSTLGLTHIFDPFRERIRSADMQDADIFLRFRRSVRAISHIDANQSAVLVN